MKKSDLFRKLPKVDEILMDERILNSDIPMKIIKNSINQSLDSIRDRIKNDEINENEYVELEFDTVVDRVLANAKTFMSPRFKKCVNAAGVVIHTNLGRSPLSLEAGRAVEKMATGYTNLEFDLKSGKRGIRYAHVEELICYLTGAEAAMVVNNNAAAVMLALSTLGSGKNVIVSRGQLVEIGGAFRVPEVMKLSGCKLYEIGTTNKTHISDYENAIEDIKSSSEEIGALLKVHTSNYRILGFTSEVSAQELSELGEKHGIVTIEDIGSGSLVDLSKYGLTKEPTVGESIAAGVDVVTFSGDKMLGGPQGGIIVGKKKYIDAMKKNQLTRAIRIDKMSLAALEATLRAYLDEEVAMNQIPTLRLLTKSVKQLEIEAGVLLNKLKSESVIDNWADELSIVDGESEVGGGSLPLEKLATKIISINPKDTKINMFVNKLRELEMPIICRVSEDRILLDVRTIFEEEYDYIVHSFVEIIKGA